MNEILESFNKNYLKGNINQELVYYIESNPFPNIYFQNQLIYKYQKIEKLLPIINSKNEFLEFKQNILNDLQDLLKIIRQTYIDFCFSSKKAASGLLVFHSVNIH